MRAILVPHDVQRIVIADALSASRNSQQRLVRETALEPVDEARDRLGLVARRLVIRLQSERFRFHVSRAEIAVGRRTRLP